MRSARATNLARETAAGAVAGVAVAIVTRRDPGALPLEFIWVGVARNQSGRVEQN